MLRKKIEEKNQENGKKIAIKRMRTKIKLKN